MTNDSFTRDALITEAPVTPEMLERLNGLVRVIHAIFGMLTELGELADVYKKHIFYGKPIDLVNVKEEFGDKFWYDAVFADATDITMDEAMLTVIEKLKARYPNAFTPTDAVERDLGHERAVLEGGHSGALFKVGDWVRFAERVSEVLWVNNEYVGIVGSSGKPQWIHQSDVLEVLEDEDS
jgi:NTP pyrophosphatase (non-canonical NTP hydrolase)